MADDLFFLLGETRHLRHEITSDTVFSISSVTADLYDATGAAVVSGAPGVANSLETDNLRWEVYYEWTPAAVGDYRYTLFYTVGTQTYAERGTALVWPAVSKLDPYLARIKSVVAESRLGEAQQQLSQVDYRDSLTEALSDYSGDNPRRVLSTLTLVGGQFEYGLSALATAAVGDVPAAAWTPRFSTFQLVEPRVDATVPTQYYLAGAVDLQDQVSVPPGGLVYLWPYSREVVDELRGVFRFAWWAPASGDTARIWWTTLHTITHTEDSLPRDASGAAVDFDPLCRYAAGVALERLAAKAAGTSEPQIGADIVSYRTKFERYLQAAKLLRDEARAKWRRRTWAF